MDNDTVKLLKECNSGIKMGENAISKLLSHVRNGDLRHSLETGKSAHALLENEACAMLKSHGAGTSTVHKFAETMSNIKIDATLMMKDNDQSVAELMTDGCNMGIKSISKYLNKYKNADEKSKSIAKRLIASEEFLENKMRDFL